MGCLVGGLVPGGVKLGELRFRVQGFRGLGV